MPPLGAPLKSPLFCSTPHCHFLACTVAQVMVNYVPGYGYAWYFLWMLIFVVMGLYIMIKKQKALMAVLFISMVYWLFWLLIPLAG